MDVSPQLLKRPWSVSSTPSTPGRQLHLDGAEAFLFETPSDLLCPITQAPFSDPVLTSSGHVYERAAIERYLRENNSDPLSRQPLVNKSLTPVYVLKSRSAEYREAAAKRCVERACSSGCPDPVRYLRRAVDLVADSRDVCVRGLSQEAIDYVVSHPSNAYDRLALQAFAQGLFQAGYRDRAASVYHHLLTSASDRTQQAHLLRCCLACWQGGVSGSPRTSGMLGVGSRSSTSSTDAGSSQGSPSKLQEGIALQKQPSLCFASVVGASGGFASTAPRAWPAGVAAAGEPCSLDMAGPSGSARSSGSSGSAYGGGALGLGAATDPHVFEKLVLLFDGQAALSWGELIDISGEAGLGEEFVVRLCEQLLFRPLPRESSCDGRPGGDVTASGSKPRSSTLGWVQEKEILLKYVRVLCQGVKDRSSEVSRQLRELEQRQQGGAGGACPGGSGGSTGLTGSRHGAARRRGGAGAGAGIEARGRSSSSPGVCRPAWLGHPVVVCGCLLVAVLAEPSSLAGRVVTAVPILALLPAAPAR
ncbi:hypothetical protein N2152v2_007896 [Parachlorella kessleri]